LGLLELLPLPENDGRLFGLTAKSLDALFGNLGLGLASTTPTLHDTRHLAISPSRHLAITRLAKKLNMLDTGPKVGYLSLKQLQVYDDGTAEAMAEQLD
jgi:hypothetical protein